MGSPLYDIAPDHVAALVAVALLPVAGWLVRWRATAGGQASARLMAGYDELPPLHRFLTWLLLVSAAVHVGLALGHGSPGIRLLFLLDAALLAVGARQLVVGGRWRALGVIVLLGSIGAYWLANLGGEPPDQVGMLTKLVELTALAIVLRPVSESRWRAAFATGLTVSLIVVTDVFAWVGAFASAGEGHHAPGGTATPGTVLPVAHGHQDPTDAERQAADSLYRATVAAIAPYQDLHLAAEAGYQVAGLAGTDFHASNPAHEADGRTFDPQRPETLVYAESPSGPILLGAMFIMPELGMPGPMVGGSLTTWHAHEHICFSVIPPAFSGILSPLGSCPLGSIDLPITPEMIHVWTVRGAPDRFGDLDDAWRQAYIDGGGAEGGVPHPH